MIKTASFSLLASLSRARCLGPTSLQKNFQLRCLASEAASDDPPKKSKKSKKEKKEKADKTEEKKTPHQMRETSFLTLESDPVNHNETHLNRFYIVPPQLQERLFTLGGFTVAQQLNHSTLRELGIMVRRPALDIIECLRKADYNKPVIRYLVWGRSGTGKNHTLNHVLHYGHNAGFLIVHCSHPYWWVRLWKAETLPSLSRPGRVDMPVESAVWLQHFRAQNARLLAELDLKTTRRYEWSLREVTEEGEPLLNVITHGINRIRHSSDCLAVVLREIKLAASKGIVRPLVICNIVNAFYGFEKFTFYTHQDGRKVEIDELTNVRAFKKLFSNDWTNGAVLVSTDRRYRLGANKRWYTPLDHDTPKKLLGDEAWQTLDPFIPIKQDLYSDAEIESVLDYYTDRLWLLRPESKTPEGRSEIKFLSGRLPEEVETICSGY